MIKQIFHNLFEEFHKLIIRYVSRHNLCCLWLSQEEGNESENVKKRRRKRNKIKNINCLVEKK